MSTDQEDAHFCLCCHATIIGLDVYVAHKQNFCPALKKNQATERQSQPAQNVSLFSSPATPSVDPSIGDFLSSLDLQIRPKEAQNESPKKGEAFDGGKQLSSIWNDFGLGSEDLLATDDLLDFSCDVDSVKVRGGKPSGKIIASYKKGEKRGGKWPPGERPTPYHRGKHHSIGKHNLYPDDEEEADEEEEKSKEENVVVEKMPEISQNIQSITTETVNNPETDHTYTQEEDRALPVNLKCVPCDRIFSNKYNYQRHITTALHLRRAGNSNQKSEVVLSLFQCLICKFGTNTKEEFWLHCSSDTHETAIRDLLGPVKCMVCKFKSRDLEEMIEHLNSKEHAEKPSKVCVLKEHRSGLACPFCGVEKKSAAGYRSHMQLHKERENFVPIKRGVRNTRKCPECDKEFRDNFNLKVHIKRVHTSDRQFKCEECSVGFIDKKSLLLHYRSRRHLSKLLRLSQNVSECQVQGKKFKCGSCSYVTDDSSQLRPHYIMCHSNGALVCDVCNVTFRKKNSLQKHMKSAQHMKVAVRKQIERSMHNSPAKSTSFSCIHCAKPFTDKALFQRHLRSHLGIKTLNCKFCPAEFTDQRQLTVHLSRTHLDTKLPHLCPHCGKSFARVSQLNVHILRRHSRTDRPYSCPKCSQRFLFQSELTRHHRSHTNERPFKCKLCPYKAKSQHEMNRHFLSHSGERSFTCDYCPYKAANKSNLLRHMRLHTGAKPYQCPYCDYSCNTLENISKHIKKSKKHIGKKLYRCPICEDFDTDSSPDFQQHMTSVHDLGKGVPSTVLAGIYQKDRDACAVAEGSLALPLREPKRNESPRTKNDHDYNVQH